MNIATSNVAPNTALLPAAPGTAQATAGADGSSASPGFGAMMTTHLADGREEHAVTNGRPGGGRGGADDTIDAKDAGAPNAGAPLDPSTIDAAATQARATVAPSMPMAASAASTSASASTTETGGLRRDKSGKDEVDDADDAAPQLAVISQWAAFAKPVESRDATPASDAVTASTGLDAKSRKSNLGASTASDAAVNDQRAGGIDAGARQDAMTPFASAGDSMASRDHRSSGSDEQKAAAPATTDASTGAAVAKTLDDAAATAHGKTAASDQNASPGANPNVTAAIGNLFATRLAAASSPSGAPASTTLPTTLHEAVGTGAWANEVGQAALKMTTSDLQTASLRLNPEHLGPLDVQVRVDNGVTHVAFGAAHADTRQALEASRTTLDQMFGSQGIRMGDVSVGTTTADGSNGRGPQSDGAQADASRRDGGQRWNAGGAADDGDATTTTVSARVSRAVGLVDTFA